MKTSDACGYHDPARFAGVNLLTEDQSKDSKEQLLGRRSRLLSSLGTTNSAAERSCPSEGVLRTSHDSEFECMNYGDDCESERDCSPERFHGPVLLTARRLLREAHDASE